MKKRVSSKPLWWIIILSAIGFITSFYLTWEHIVASSSGSICDISAKISCSLVNSSIYSELLSVPVAVFGALWFVILSLVAWRSMKNNDLLDLLLGWSILGVVFIIYMIIAEILLNTICPFCTLVHIIVVIVFIIALRLYRSKKKKFSYSKFIKKAKPWIILALIINIIPLIIFNLPQSEKVNYDSLAQCITEKGVNMYGSFKCGVCAKTRDMFGSSFEYINEIECHPQGENQQTDLCLKKGLEGTPTWVLEPNGEEVKRVTGFMDIEELAEFSGCDVENAS